MAKLRAPFRNFAKASKTSTFWPRSVFVYESVWAGEAVDIVPRILTSEPDTDVGQLRAHATLHSQTQLPVYNGYIDRCVVVGGGGAQSLDAANKNLSCLCRATNPDSSAAQPYPSHKSKWAVPILFFSNTVLVILRSAAQTNNSSK